MKRLFILTIIIAFSCCLLQISNGSGKFHSPTIKNGNGTSSSTGAPGEAHTCSQSGCHGSGNGSASSNGLADNAGLGSISVTSNPTMTGNQYIPRQVYQITVTVSETGKSIFGFDCEILNNSGNTNLMTNDTTGSITITDPNRTRIAQAYGTGRLCVTHKSGAGLANNTSSFTFNWQAPASGTANFWYSSVAGNNDGLPNAIDNVYKGHFSVTPASPAACLANFTSLVNNLQVNLTNLSTNAASCSWNFGDGNSSTLCGNQSHTYAANGTYPICLTITNLSQTCSNTFCDTLTVQSSGMASNEQDLISIGVLPNPITDYFNISFNSPFTFHYSFKIMAADGSIVAMADQLSAVKGYSIKQINCQNWSPGIYYTLIRTPFGVKTMPQVKL